LSYARIGYHYARPGMMDDIMPIMPEDLRYLQMPENWEPVAKMGSMNSLFYATETLVKDKSNTLIRDGRMWEGSKLFVWKPEKIHDQKVLTFPVKTTGNKRIYLTAALTPSSGQFSVTVDGKPALFADKSESVDLYRPYRTLSRNFSLKVIALKQGEHTLTLKYTGANDAVTNPEIGIDFIWVQSTQSKVGE